MLSTPLPVENPAIEQAIDLLARQFIASFPVERPALRTVGREAEFPVVTATGAAADVRRMVPHLLEAGDLTAEYGAGTRGDFIVGLTGADYNFSLEVGLGTLEVSTRPCTDLWEIKRLIEEAVTRMARAAARCGYRVLGYGIQPMSPPSLHLLTPKQRYLSLYRAMGEAWLWYTVTAADQTHVALRREEMVAMLNFGNLMTPVIIALCGDSPVYAGALSPFASAREGVMNGIRASEHRHGMFTRPMVDMQDFVRTMSQATYLIVRAGGQIVPSSRPYTAYLAEEGADFKAFLFHEHYIWNSARLRANYGTIEIRPACQQPWKEHMAVAALNLGLVEAAPRIDRYVQDVLGPDYWEMMRTYHQQAMRHGLAAPQPAPHFLETIVALAGEGLATRKLGEEQLLEPLHHRLELRQNPAQRVRRFFVSDGLAATVQSLIIPAANPRRGGQLPIRGG